MNRGNSLLVAFSFAAALGTLTASAQQADQTNFLADAIRGNVAEVKLGQLAAERAQSQQVREYGDMLEERSHEVTREGEQSRERDRRSGFERAHRSAAEAVRIAAEIVRRRIRHDVPEPNGSRAPDRDRQVQRAGTKRLGSAGQGVREGHVADAAGALAARAIDTVGVEERDTVRRAARRIL